MTLIGFTCKEGVCLVADTKITNGELDEGKISTPIENAPFIIGTAGASSLAY